MYDYVIESQGKLLERIVNERLWVDMTGMSFKANDKFYETFNRKFQQMFTAGLIDHFKAYNKEKMNPKLYAHLNAGGPQVLTMEHLEAGFVVWLVSLSFAVLAFILEWIVKLCGDRILLKLKR